MKGDDSETVVGRARAGDMDAFRCLVQHHSRDVFRLAFRITRNEQDAEDAVQETFLKAYGKLKEFDGRSSISTWLYRVAANSSIDILRRRRREESRSASLDDPGFHPHGQPREEAAQDRLVHSRQIQERLGAALGELTELERTAFLLRHFEDFPLSEIGRALGLRTSATKHAVFRAVRKLRKSLEPLVEVPS